MPEETTNEVKPLQTGDKIKVEVIATVVTVGGGNVHAYVDAANVNIPEDKVQRA